MRPVREWAKDAIVRASIIRMRCSAICRAWSSGPGSMGIISGLLGGFQAPERLIDVDLSASDLLHQLEA